MIIGISEQDLNYQIYLEECEEFDEEPLDFDEWLQEETRKRAEMYGD